MNLETFRHETREWLEANCPASMRGRSVHFEDAFDVYNTDDARLWLAARGRAGLDRARLAEGVRRRWAEPRRSPRAEPGDGRDPRASARHRHGPRHDRSHAARVRHRGAEAAPSAANRQRRGALVPGLQRARFRLRPGQPQNPGRARWRPLRDQRPEDLDLGRRPRRLDVLPGPHRSRRAQARRHQLPAAGDEAARRNGQADPADLRVRRRSAKPSSTMRSPGRKTWSAS